MSIDAKELKDVISSRQYRKIFSELGVDLEHEHAGPDGWINHLYKPSILGEDRNPSFSVSVESGAIRDFGSTLEGDVYDLVQEVKDYDFPDAVKWVASRTFDDILHDIENDETMAEDPISVEKVEGASKRLLQSQEDVAQNNKEYLIERGILPESISQLLIGLITRDDGNWIIVPYAAKDNQVHQYKLFGVKESGGWRKKSGDKVVKTGGKRHPLYLGHALQTKRDGAIVLEGEFDSIVVSQLGYNAVSVANGAGSFRPEWAETFRSCGFSTITLCYDADGEGRKGAKKAARILQKYDFDVYNVELPDGKDATDVYLEEGEDELIRFFKNSEKLEVEEKEEFDVQDIPVRKIMLYLRSHKDKMSKQDRQEVLRQAMVLFSDWGYTITKLYD